MTSMTMMTIANRSRNGGRRLLQRHLNCYYGSGSNNIGSHVTRAIISSYHDAIINNDDETKHSASSSLQQQQHNNTIVETNGPIPRFIIATNVTPTSSLALLSSLPETRNYHTYHRQHSSPHHRYHYKNNHLSFENTIHQLTQRVFFSSNTTPPSSSSSEPLKSTDAPKKSFSSTAQSQQQQLAKEPSFPISVQKIKDVIAAAGRGIANFIMKTPGVLWYYLTNPTKFRERMIELKESAKKEAHHYWMGTKLLAADLRTARRMLARTLQGSALTRRERKQLLRTTADLFRLVPMSMFVLIPFMEFALPFALKIFPNMLPSTFQDSLKAEESMKRELQTRIAMAGFFQETLHSLAKEQKKRATAIIKDSKESEDEGEEEHCRTTTKKEEETASSFLKFLEDARAGKAVTPDVIIKFATYFKDELTLDNMSRMQLVNMCRYMSIPPYGADSLLRFQLRHKIRGLKDDDQRILWEGIDSLTKMELREACQERGMRSTGLSKEAYRSNLQQWLDLSVNKDVPISLLIMSRTFFLRDEMESRTATAAVPKKDAAATAATADVAKDKTIPVADKTVASIADAISGLEKGVLNEVVLEVATREEQTTNADVLKIKLEVLDQQNQLINEEYEMRKKQKEEEKEKKEKLEKEKQLLAEKEKMEKEKAAAAAKEATMMAAGKTEDIIDQQAATSSPSQPADQITFSVEEEKKAAAAAATVDATKATTVESTPHSTTIDASATPPSSPITESPTTTIATQPEDSTTDDVKSKSDKTTTTTPDDDDDDDDTELSAEEIEAISQLLSPNAVEQERLELERIKSQMATKADDDEDEETEVVADDGVIVDDASGMVTDAAAATMAATASDKVSATDTTTPATPLDTTTVAIDDKSQQQQQKKEEPMTSSEADDLAAKTIAAQDAMLSDVDKDVISHGTTISNTTDKADTTAATAETTAAATATPSDDDTPSPPPPSDDKLDRSIIRLKSKLHDMLTKIELQLDDYQTKIGDRLHFLDKDGDGLLTREEMALCLRTVLKRELSHEEAMAIAADMDENEDGIFTVAELGKWIENHKLVRLVEEGRDVEVDKMIENSLMKKREEEEVEREREEQMTMAAVAEKDGGKKKKSKTVKTAAEEVVDKMSS